MGAPEMGTPEMSRIAALGLGFFVHSQMKQQEDVRIFQFVPRIGVMAISVKRCGKLLRIS
jgi:hypothetical protein